VEFVLSITIARWGLQGDISILAKVELIVQQVQLGLCFVHQGNHASKAPIKALDLMLS
jgi:hypothetical protein